MGELFGLLVFLGLIVIAYFIGKNIEQSHYKQLEEREAQLLHLPTVTGQRFIKTEQVEDVCLVVGNVVISGDYFKMILAGLLNFFGGRIVSYETLIDRARRESVLRMKEKAQAFGADIILNTRFETSKLDSMGPQQQQSTGMFEIMAYGTAVKLKK